MRRADIFPTMSIQFSCPSCNQPIEVDDQWAAQQVACPFCRNTVTTPRRSTYIAPVEVPQARTIEPAAPGLAPDVDQAVPRGNPVAVWAFGLSCLWLLALVGFVMIFAARVVEVVGHDATPEEIQRFFLEQAQSGNVPAWLTQAGLLLLMAGLFWVAGLVCAILGIRQRPRRGFAIAAFVLLSSGPLMLCSGFFTPG